jgi:hypothetical protein
MSRINLSEGEITRYYEARIPKLHRLGGELRAACPIHKGQRESFAVNVETGQWFCHSQCGRGGSIFDFETELTGSNGKEARDAVLQLAGHLEQERRLVATYDYTDEQGKLLYQTVRYEPKDFKQRRPDGAGGWIWNLKNTRLVLYRLPAVLKAPVVFVVEGEKDADALTELGVVATTSPLGAGKWRSQYSEVLRGKQVFIIPDADEKGRQHAQGALGSIRGVAAACKLVPLPEAKDAAQWLARGGTLDALTALCERETPPEPAGKWKPNGHAAPVVLSCAEILRIATPPSDTLFDDGYPLPARGLTLKVGAPKSGKTLLAVQEALAIARGQPLFDYYRTRKQGAVMIVEQDDPDGAVSIKGVLERCGVSSDTPIYVVPELTFGFGAALLDWLAEQIGRLRLVLIVMDSYTAIRGSRTPGADIVKQEQAELRQLDALAKKHACAIQLITHASKGAAALDWTQNAAGSYVMAGASEAQVHVSRFAEFDSGATERLIRIRARHAEDAQIVARFRKDRLDYEHVLEGGAAPLYPALEQIRREFGSGDFSAKDLWSATGISRSTAFRVLDRLRLASAIQKRSHGQYFLTAI